ncbi:hypothetical protein F4677DRAFT_453332 [Hypoxylon crocopeplum]|nr:hypothetical protein F4677DRAFT_453332 [Hypoxylon crocopeplum]
MAQDAQRHPAYIIQHQPCRDSRQSKITKIRLFKFTNTQDLFQVINCTSGDFLIVTDRTIRRREFRWRRYHAESRILTITIPTRVHEKLHLLLYEKYRSTIFRISYPEGDSGQDDSTAGEGGSTGGPVPERGGLDKWPTLAIEAGDSESLDHLHMDMQWWFAASDHDVKIVIPAKLDRRQRNIILEKWEEDAAVPILQQTITISRNEATSPVSYNVTRALVFEFRLLFLRNPAPQEGDFIISIPDLQRYAERVWAQV